jgi:hypothetical protein
LVGSVWLILMGVLLLSGSYPMVATTFDGSLSRTKP